MKNFQQASFLLTLKKSFPSLCSYFLKEHLNCPSESATGGIYKKTVLKNFAKFTGKHLCWSFFFNKFDNCLIRSYSSQVCGFSKKSHFQVKHFCSRLSFRNNILKTKSHESVLPEFHAY